MSDGLEALSGVGTLVTGGAGFIGSHLVDALLDSGVAVRVLDDLSTGSAENLGGVTERVDLRVADIRNPEACRSAMEGCELVFHQAALGSVPRSMQDPITSLEVNAQGTATVFKAAVDAGVKRVVYASSSSVYGDSGTLPKREGEEGRPLSPYALSKVMCEELAEVFGRCYGLETVGLRYFNVYGPRQDPSGPYAAVVPRFFAALSAGRPVTIHGDGEQSRDFTAVHDAVRANLLAAVAGPAAVGRAFNVAAGQRTTVNDLARAVASVLGVELRADNEPARPGDVRHSLADGLAAAKALGYRAELSLEEGLRRAADWYGRPLESA